MKKMNHPKMTKEPPDKINKNRLEPPVAEEQEAQEIKPFNSRDSTNNKDSNTKLNFKSKNNKN